MAYALNSLIEDMYSAALGALPLPEVLRGIADCVGYGVAGLVSPQGTGEGRFCVAAHGIEAADCDSFERTTGWTQRLISHLPAGLLSGRVYFRDDLIDPGTMRTDPAYREFLLPRAVNDGILAAIDGGTQSQIVINLACPSASASRERVMERMHTLLPHMARALEVSRALAGLESLRHAHAATLSISPWPVVVFDSACKVFIANQAAVGAFTGQGLRLTDEGLRAQLDTDNQQLQRLLRRVVESTNRFGQPLAGGELQIRRSNGKRPLHLLLAPLPPAHFRPGLRPAAIAIVHDPDDVVHVPPDRIRQLYGLTRAEAVVALAVMNGRSLQEIAAEQGQALATTRNLLKRIFAKTGARRQSELVTMPLRLPLMFDLEALTRTIPPRN